MKYDYEILNEDDRLCFDEFMIKYKDNILNHNIDKDTLSNLVSSALSVYEFNENEILRRIRYIYIAIISIKYFDTDPERSCKDEGKIYDLVENINDIKNDIHFRYYETEKLYDIDKLCKRVYISLLDKDYCYHEFLEYDVPINEFSPDHLLDIKYHLNNFKEWGYFDKDFINTIDTEFRRYL